MNDTLTCVYLYISKIRSILVVAILLALTLYGPNSFFRRFSGPNLR